MKKIQAIFKPMRDRKENANSLNVVQNETVTWPNSHWIHSWLWLLIIIMGPDLMSSFETDHQFVCSTLFTPLRCWLRQLVVMNSMENEGKTGWKVE